MSPRGRPRTQLHSRFWLKVAKGEPADCWEWTGSIDHGYGVIGGGAPIGKSMRAHRASWLLHHGEIPAGLHVLHRCDNPPCVNPAHLFLGTHDDNMADRDAKGRTLSGDLHGRAKLSNAQVVQIRAKHSAGGASIRELAGEYAVSFRTVRGIVNGATWKCLLKEAR